MKSKRLFYFFSLFVAVIMALLIFITCAVDGGSSGGGGGSSGGGDSGGGDSGGASETIYACGAYNEGGLWKPCYWIGTTRTFLPLPVGATEGGTREIAISGENIYICGFYKDGSGSDHACYWINDTGPNDLIGPVGTVNSEATSIFIYNGNIYISGTYWTSIAPPPDDDFFACYWQIGVGIQDLDCAGDDGETQDIYAYNNIVYTCGQYDQGARDIGCYWEGTTKHDLDIPIDAEDGQSFSIFINSTNVYNAGYYENAAGDFIPCYWEGTTKHNLDIDAGGEGIVSHIVVNNGIIYTSGWYDDGINHHASYWIGTVRTDIAGYIDAGKIIIKDGNFYIEVRDAADGQYLLKNESVIYTAESGAIIRDLTIK